MEYVNLMIIATGAPGTGKGKVIKETGEYLKRNGWKKIRDIDEHGEVYQKSSKKILNA